MVVSCPLKAGMHSNQESKKEDYADHVWPRAGPTTQTKRNSKHRRSGASFFIPEDVNHSKTIPFY
eukprot:172027-Pelagomonas_calceolata.AAC.1